jgi:molecular chaperone DnaK
VEKNIKEFGDKIDAAEKAKIEEGVAKVKKAIEGDDLEAIKTAQEELTNASHKLAEAMYAKTAQQQPGAGAGPQPGAEAGPGAGEQAGGGKKDDDVVDADFEDVKK